MNRSGWIIVAVLAVFSLLSTILAGRRAAVRA